MQKTSSKNTITVIVPSRPNIDNLLALIKSFNQQDISKIWKFSLSIIIDKVLTQQEYKNIKKKLITQVNSDKIALNIFTNCNCDFKPQKNASATRNYGILHSDTEFSLLLDDDIIVAPEYLASLMKKYQHYHQQEQKDLVLAGTLLYRDTDSIQNQGFKDYNYFFSRPQLNFLGEKQRDYIRMYGGCGMFTKTSIFQEFLFDERIDFIIEDIDFSYRISKNYPMIADKDISIHHMDREKTILEDTQVGNPFSSYRKGKNRIVFVKKNANIFQKIIFYTLGLHLSNLWLSIKIFRFWWKARWAILKSFWKGTWEGLRENK